MTDPVQPGGEGAVRRLTRIRAVAAAVAAGGVASLSVVLIGAPSAVAVTASSVVVAQEATSVAEPVRRPDITLGAAR